MSKTMIYRFASILGPDRQNKMFKEPPLVVGHQVARHHYPQ